MSLSFSVIDKIAECQDHRSSPLSETKIDTIIVHRTIWTPNDAAGICKRFQEDPELAEITGGENPYHILINATDSGASITQCIRLLEVGQHARRFNRRAIGVALCFDTLHAPLPHAMGQALIQVLKPLVFWAGPTVAGTLYGHDELPGASSDPNKKCPGIDMAMVRALVAEHLDPWIGGPGDNAALKRRVLRDCGLRLV